MKNFKRFISVVLVLAMIFAMTGSMSYAADFRNEKPTSTLTFNTLSDPHYYPYSLTGDNCEIWRKYNTSSAKLYNQSETIIRTAIETMVKRNPDLKYILIPGDLTKDGEYEAHVALAAILKEYEAKYGLEFIVINGNHDINQDRAITFENGKKERARSIQASEFPQVYADLGYDLAFERYAKDTDNIQGQLSYAVDLDGGYRLIVIDSGKYTFSPETADHKTDGMVTPELMEWVKGLALSAVAEGKTPMVMTHHGLAAHMETEPSITFAFPMDNYMDVAEAFASWGIHYAFTGHLHTNDIACTVNDDGEVLYDCETASLTGYPCTYREMTVKTYADGESEMSYSSVNFDAEEKMVYDGVTYENNTYKKKAFALCFGGNVSSDGEPSCGDFLLEIVKSFLGGYIEDIKEAGSIEAFLKTMNLDLEALIGGFLEPYIGQGIKVGGYNIFSVDNIMWFINDLLGQVYDLYIKDPDALYSVIGSLIDQLLAIPVSEYPCTEFMDSLGFGDKNKPGDLGDCIFSAMAYWYGGNEDAAKDKFLQDAIANFEEGTLVETVFNKLIDLLIGDLIEDAILSKLEIRLDKLFNDDEIGKRLGEGINYLLKYVLRGDFTYMNLVNTIFELGVLPYKSIYDILDQEVMQKYLTFSQMEGVGAYIAFVLNDFTSDENPAFKGDYDIVYSTVAITPEATRENYRLPTMVSVTLGEEKNTSAYINWFSKSTVGGDIEIYKSEAMPQFKGIPTDKADFGIDIKTEQVTRSFPGIDIGIMGFITYNFKMNRHTVTLTNLEPGATYYYRVGSAARGWWSEPAKLTVADASKNTTFIHTADPQSQSQPQYERAWANVLKAAFSNNPDIDFIINTGDLVDHGDNQKQWAWMFNTASDSLMNTYLMPATGNHEGKGTNATVNNFTLPNVPQQDTTSGVYYSFDYNNTHFAVLNTEDLGEDDGLSEKQLQWLRQDMTASDAQWKFVVLHKAPYSQGSHYDDDDVCAIRSQLGVLMPELGIDIVFQGHDHVYMRTGSLVDNKRTAYDSQYLNFGGKVYRAQVQPTGTTYVISGTCGVKTYIQNDPTLTDEFFPRGEKILSVDAPMYSEVKIVDGILYFDAYTVTDEGVTAVDSIAIQKDTTQGDVAEGYTPPADGNDEEEDRYASFKKFLNTLLKIMTVIVNIIRIYFVPSVK